MWKMASGGEEWRNVEQNTKIVLDVELLSKISQKKKTYLIYTGR